MNLASVLVHFGHPELTKRMLERLQTYDIISRVAVVIHDDARFDDFGERVIYLREENRGYAAGINCSVRHLIENFPETDVVLALNPDVKIEEAEMLDLLDEHISSKSGCTFPALSESARVNHGYRFTRWGTVKTIRLASNDADFYSGACFLFSVTAWKQVNGLDEKYFHYFEDADFCRRLRMAHCPIHHAAEVLVQHTGKSGVDYPATVLPRYAVRNHLRFLRESEKLNALSFCNVVGRQLFYLFRWKQGWRGIPQWWTGIQEFVQSKPTEPLPS